MDLKEEPMIAVALLVLALVVIIGSAYVARRRRQKALLNGDFVFDPIPRHENSGPDNDDEDDEEIMVALSREPITAYKGYAPGDVINGIPTHNITSTFW
jgi:hypothetical protein